LTENENTRFYARLRTENHLSTTHALPLGNRALVRDKNSSSWFTLFNGHNYGTSASLGIPAALTLAGELHRGLPSDLHRPSSAWGFNLCWL